MPGPDPTRSPWAPRSARGLALACVGVAIAYFVAARLGLQLTFVNASASPVWPPTGLALAALLLLGPRAWPGVLAGAYAANALTTGWGWPSLTIAFGNTLEALAGWWLVDRFANGTRFLETASNVGRFAVLASLGSTLLSATVGVATLVASGNAAANLASTIWTTWWLGDATGSLIVAPAIVALATPQARAAGRLPEALLVGFLLLALATIIFSPTLHEAPLLFLIVPLPMMAWAAVRFGPRGAALATLALSFIAVIGTLRGYGPLAGALNQELLAVQAYLAAVGLATLASSAIWSRLPSTRGADEAYLRNVLLTNGLASAVLVAGIGLVVLTGWLLDLAWLRSPLPTLEAMKANAAVGLASLGAAMILSRGGRPLGRVGTSLALLPVGIGTLTLIQYAVGVDLRIDELLADAVATTETPFPARMSPFTAAGLALLGAALVLRDGPGRWRNTSDALAGVTVLLGLLALTGQVFGASLFATTTQIALPTAIALLLAAGALPALEPSRGLGRLLASADVDGRLARLLPVGIAGVPLALGVVGLELERQGVLSFEQSVVLAIFGSMVLVAAVAMVAISQAQTILSQRQEAQARLLAADEQLRKSLQDAEEARKRFVHLFRSTPMGMLLTRMDASVVDANEAASHLWGYSRDEMLDPAFRTTRFFSDPAERDKLAHAVRTKGGARDLAVRMQRKDGTLRQFLFNVEIIELGGEKLFLSAGNDITQLHEAQEARAKALRSVAEAERIMGRGSWEWDVSTNRAVWSDGMYRLFGLDPATFDNANENFLAMVHPDDRARMGQAIADAMAKPGRFLQEYRLRRPDGEERFIRGEGNVQTTPDGKPHVLYGFVQDVTDLRALEAEKAKAEEDRRRAQERFARVFEASPAPILLTKDDGRVVDANQAFSRLFGYSKAELTGPGFSAVSLYAHAGDRPRLLARLRENALVRDTDLEVVAKDGTRHDVAISMEFIDLGGQTTILSVFLDVTDRKRQQAEREARIASEAELERLRRTDKFRVEFINSTAHELRTPLTPLMASVAILRKFAASDARMQDQLAVMQRAVDRLHRVAEDLVGAADTQARAIALDKRRLSVGRELRAAVASHQAAAERNGVALSDPDDPGLSVVADPQRLQLVLGHFLGNALKFTPAGGRVWLAARRDGDHVRVSVNDTGVGLTRAQMDGLWKPFAQAHDKEQRTDSGSGLGLYVTRGIIEAHGGEVGVSSPGPGKGSTFWFALPLAPGNVDPLLKAPAEPETKKRGRLTLDGDPDDVA